MKPKLTFFMSRSFVRAPQSSRVPSAEAQNQPEASHAIHHVPAAGTGAQVPPEAVPVHRGTCRVLELAQPDRDTGEDLVPEPACKGQAAAGGRAGEAEDGRQAHATSSLRYFLSTGHTHACVLRGCTPIPEARRARVTRRTVCSTHGIQHVSLSVRPMPLSLGHSPKTHFSSLAWEPNSN